MSGLTLQDRITHARRLRILQLLAESPGYEASQELLYQALENASMTAVSSDLSWLTECGLTTRRAISELALARLTTRGMDVAHGRERVDGVARPTP